MGNQRTPGVGGIYREVLFELVDGQPATPLFRALVHEPAARARLQALSVGNEVSSVLIDYNGPVAAVEALREVVLRTPDPTVLFFDTLLDEERRFRFVASWSRPTLPTDGVSLEHLLHDLVGPGGLLFGRVEAGVIAYKAASPDGRNLGAFLEAVDGAFNGRFRVRTLRTGVFRPGWEIDDGPAKISPEYEALLAIALSAGYYDEPKRCGVRELGDALGVSKSVVARRLRTLERMALQRLAH